MTCSHCSHKATTEVYEMGVKQSEVMCDRCADEARRDLAWLRVRFDALLASGMTREDANSTMIRVYVPQVVER